MTSHGQHERMHGLRFARKEIAKMIPKHELYVEPFAGHAWVMHELEPKKAVVGDVVCKNLEWIEKHHKPEGDITYKCQDWRKTVQETDSPNTFFLFDPPWTGKGASRECPLAYKGNCQDYRKEVIETAKRLQGKSIITLGDHPENKEMLCQPPFKCKELNIAHGKLHFKYLVGKNF